MKLSILYFAFAMLIFSSCKQHDKTGDKKESKENMSDSIDFKSGYSDVNGIKMYYEIHGEGWPLVMLHGGGSTIQSSFGRIIPQLAKHYKVIAVELQNHGRTGSRNVPQTFEQDADDVAALLKNLEISEAYFLGFSNGGTTSMQIGIRHPGIVTKLVLVAAAAKRSGFPKDFFDWMKQGTIASMPQELKTAFLEVNPDSAKLQIMFERDRDRMIAFKDMSDEQLKSISSPTLIINGDQDVVSPEHAVEMHRLIPKCRLAILPGTHGKCIGEVTTLVNGKADTEHVVSMISEFLEMPVAPKQ